MGRHEPSLHPRVSQRCTRLRWLRPSRWDLVSWGFHSRPWIRLSAAFFGRLLGQAEPCGSAHWQRVDAPEWSSIYNIAACGQSRRPCLYQTQASDPMVRTCPPDNSPRGLRQSCDHRPSSCGETMYHPEIPWGKTGVPCHRLVGYPARQNHPCAAQDRNVCQRHRISATSCR